MERVRDLIRLKKRPLVSSRIYPNETRPLRIVFKDGNLQPEIIDTNRFRIHWIEKDVEVRV